MPRHRRVWLRPADGSSTLDQATSIGVALPSFNFIEPKTPKHRPRPPPTTQLPSLNPSRSGSRSNNAPPPTASADKLSVECDGIVRQTLQRWAQELDEPTLSEESKMARLWQSLLRHSEAGRFSKVTEYTPNAICSFMAMELLQQILQASGVSLMLVNLLVGAVGNSIFVHYTPEQPQHEMQQFADMATELKNELALKTEDLTATKKQVSVHKSQLAAFQISEQERDSSTVQDKAQLITAVLRSLDEPAHVSLVITDALKPFLNDEMMLVLWNATARITASQSLSEEEEDTDDSTSTSIVDSRKRASSLAARVLQERVRLMLTQYYTLSAEEQGIVSSRLAAASTDHNPSAIALKGILQTLEEVYISEQLRDKAAPRRSMFLSPMARHGSLIARSTGLEGVGPPRVPVPGARASRTMSMYFNPAAPTPQATAPPPVLTNVSIPDVLLGALSDGQHVAGTDESKLLIEQLSSEQDELLNRCEDIFDLLCRDPIEVLASKRVPEGVIDEDDEDTDPDDGAAASTANVQLAKQQLCELLCSYVDAPSFIMEKFEKSEAIRTMRETAARESEDGNGIGTTVQTIIQWQKQNPMVLVNAINQSPEILLTAISQNNGILRFAMTKFAPLVKRFLRLDLKACEHLDVLAHKNKGVQLLWGTTNSTVGPSSSSTAADGRGSVRGGGFDRQNSADGVDQAPLLTVSDVLDEVMGRRTSILSILANTSSPTRGATLAAGEVHLLQWFSAHTADLAALALKRPDLLKPLFVEMHTQGDAGPFYKVMVQLSATKGVQNFFHRASMTTLERIAQEDPAEVTRLLREILRDPPNRDLVHQLQTSPYLATCLSEFHPTVIQDVISSDMETWKQFFVETVAANDPMLKECLVTRTEDLEGGDTLVQLFSAVVSAATSGLNLAALDFGASATDVTMAKEREVASKRKMVQCLYMRGGVSVFRSVVAQLVATVGYHPHEFRSGSASVTHDVGVHRTSTSRVLSMKAPSSRPHGKKSHRGSSNIPLKKRPQSSITRKDDVAGSVYENTHSQDDHPGTLTTRGSGVYQQQATAASLHAHIPLMWQSFVHAFQRHQLQHSVDAEFSVPKLSRAHTKTLILDLWIEFLKVDTLQLDNSCLWTMTPFVCDCLVTRYDSPIVVGAWIHALTEALIAFQDDPRVAFFATACGLRLNTTTSSAVDGYDTFLYYAHALGHLLFGQMKVFRPECRLEETVDGSCPVTKCFVTTTAARLFDHRLLSGNEINDLMTRLETLPVTLDAEKQVETVELDDAMQVFLDQWRLVNSHLDERYKAAFRLCDSSGSDTIGLEQFTKIVTNVTQQRISPRECLLVYCDVGEELLDLETLLRVTHVYHLRLFNVQLPEISLGEDDLQVLKLSTGRSNIFSPAREVEDLQRFWRGLRAEVRFQVDSPHQSKSTKMHLKKQTALVEKLLGEIQTQAQASGGASSTGASPAIRLRSPLPHQKPPNVGATQGAAPQLLQKAWQELRVCAKILNSAKLTQHCLSRLYIQSCIVGWIRKTRKRRARLAAEAAAAQDVGDPPHQIQGKA